MEEFAGQPTKASPQTPLLVERGFCYCGFDLTPVIADLIPVIADLIPVIAGLTPVIAGLTRNLF